MRLKRSITRRIKDFVFKLKEFTLHRAKFFLCIFFIFFLFSFSSLAADTYKDWVYDKGTVSFDGKTFKLNIISDMVKVDSEGFIIIIDEGQCVYVDNVNVCLMNISYDLEKDSFEAQINLTKKYADLLITRKLSSSTLILGKEYYVDVTLENKGNNLAKDIDYAEFIPDSLVELTSCDDCDIEGEKIIFKDSLGSKEKITFRYYFIPISDEEYNYNGEVEYYSKEKKENFYTSSLKINPSHPIKVTFKYNTFSLLGDDVELSVVITNNQDEDVNIDDVQIYIPSNLDIEINNREYESGKAHSLGSSHLDDKTTTYTEIITHSELINGSYVDVNETVTRINESDTKNFLIKAIPNLLGNYEFIFDIYYEYNDRLFTYRGVKSKFTIKGLTPSINTNIKDNQHYDETSKQYIYIQLMNPYEHISVNDAKLMVDSPLLFKPRTLNIESIDKGVSKRIFFESLTFPKLNGSDVSTYFQYNLSFYDDYGNFYELNDKIPFKIVPLNNLLIASSGCENVGFDKECKVTVTVTNKLKGELSSVFIRDVFDNKITTEGVLYDKAHMDGDQKITAYTYNIIYPKEISDFVKSVNITTFASYEYVGEKYSLSKTRTINFEDFSTDKKEFNLGLSTIFDSSTFYQGSIYPVTLVVENKDDEIMNNLVLGLEESPDFDLVDIRKKNFEGLNPGEKKYFRFYIKIKTNESTSLIGKLSFRNLKGYSYEKTFAGKKINVISEEPIGPFITIELYPDNNEPKIGDLVPVNIRIDNKGTEEISLEVRFSEDELEQTLYLKPDAFRILKEGILMHSEGNISVPVVISEYEYAKRKYYLFSNELVLQAKPLKIAVEQEEIKTEMPEEDDNQNINKNEEQIINNNQTNELDIIEVEKKEEGSWFSRFIGKIKSFFTI